MKNTLNHLWYRAPELLLDYDEYDRKVDIYALGALIAEMYLFKPLITGDDVKSQLYKMYAVLGYPRKKDFQKGYEDAKKTKGYKEFRYPSLPNILEQAPIEAVDLVMKMMDHDPDQRPDASDLLRHEFFSEPDVDPRAFIKSRVAKKKNRYLPSEFDRDSDDS